MAWIINHILLSFIGLIASFPIIQLDDKNFTNFTKTNAFTFIVIHAPWCDQCEALLKEVNIANEYISELNPPRYIASVDLEGSNTHEIESVLELSSVPAMYLSFKDKYVEYKGLLKASSIITFILKNSGKAVNTLSTLEHITDFINPKTTYMSAISFRKSNEQSFEQIAKQITYCLFANCYSEECFNYFKPQSDFIILKPFEIEKYLRIDLSYESETKLLSSIYLNTLPSLGKFSDFGIDIIFKNEIRSLCFIEVNKNNDSKIVRDFIDKHYQEYYVFVFDVTDKKDIELLGFFGYEPNDFTFNEIFLIDFPTKQFAIYRMKQEEKTLSVESIEEFLNNAKTNVIQREMRSEAVPKNQPRKNLKIIVGKTFEKEVLKNNKQVVIVGYVIANCEKCNLLQQIFDSLSNRYEDNDDILFALIDPVFNDIPGLTINTPFSPLIHYYLKDKSKPYILFDKSITAKNLIDFIKEQNKVFGLEYNEEL